MAPANARAAIACQRSEIAQKRVRQLNADLEAQGTALVFAVNGGMYHKDLSAVGYFVENRVKLREGRTFP